MTNLKLKLSHVAVAVENLEAAKTFYTLLGLDFSPEVEEVPSQKVKTAFAPITESYAHLELLESTDPEGPVGQFLKKKGAGIHHLCFETEDIYSLMATLKEKNISLIYELPQIGAGGCLVNFIHPKYSGGVLIELSQRRKQQ